MLPMAWNIQDSWFSGLSSLKAEHFCIHVEIKNCRTENNLCLVGGLPGQSDQSHEDNLKNKGFWHQEMCNNQQYSLPCKFKRILKSISGKMVLCDTSLTSSWSVGFPNKVTVPCPSNLSLDLLGCCAVSSTNLDSVTVWIPTLTLTGSIVSAGDLTLVSLFVNLG